MKNFIIHQLSINKPIFYFESDLFSRRFENLKEAEKWCKDNSDKNYQYSVVSDNVLKGFK